MSRQRETNPHFLPRDNIDPVIDFPSRAPLPRRSRPVPTPPGPHHHTSVEPHYAPGPQPPQRHPSPPIKPTPPLQVEAPPPQPHHDPQPLGRSHHHGGGGPHFGRHGGAGPYPEHHSPHPSLLQGPSSRRTRPFAWLVAAFCALFWIIIIVGGLIILIVYLIFRPRSPRFDISTVTLNAVYLDMGYLLNADMTVLANFTNPNTKVKVDFNYVILDLYFENYFIATRYIDPFSVRREESRFADVHMVSSQVRLSNELTTSLQRQVERGRVVFQVKGLFKAKSKLGGIFHYSYYLNANCQIEVTGPPTGVLIGKRCITKR